MERESEGQELLRHAEESFHLLVDSVIDYAIFLLDANGNIATWNRGAERLKGYQADEIIGRHFSCFYPEADIEAGKPDWELEVARAEGRVEDEGWRIRKDGTRFWANVVITALFEPDGTFRGYGKVTRDLTARKLMEDSLRDSLATERQSGDRLRDLDRLKNEFVSIVAHDLKSPLSVLRGFSDILLQNWDAIDEQKKKDVILRISRATEHLTKLVNDILDASRIQSGELSLTLGPVDVGAVVGRAVAETAVAQERISVVRPETIPLAWADEGRTWQIITNLLSNALKFSGDEPVEIRVDHEDPFIRVSVKDRGPGIREADRPKLFERFARLPQAVNAPVKGSGLGLYIAKSMVELQGGSISVETAPSKGSTFSFTLPVAPAS